MYGYKLRPGMQTNSGLVVAILKPYINRDVRVIKLRTRRSRVEYHEVPGNVKYRIVP